MILFVAGSGLRVVCGDQSAIGLRFLREAYTLPCYRLYGVDDRFAAMVEVPEGGIAVLGELCELPDERLAGILAGEPKGVTLGPVRLGDGAIASGPIASAATLPEGARDISAFGGFGAYYLSARRPPAQAR
jgi:hypothetical protein